jgi:hypothetical protein
MEKTPVRIANRIGVIPAANDLLEKRQSQYLLMVKKRLPIFILNRDLCFGLKSLRSPMATTYRSPMIFSLSYSLPMSINHPASLSPSHPTGLHCSLFLFE